MLDVTDVCAALTEVWVAVLQAALDAVTRANLPKSGDAPAAIAVIGMGRLGGRELGYGSDADVLFVCEPAEGVQDSDAVRWAVTVAEQMRALLGTPSADPPLEVDANLRPEGRSGPLVRTLASYAAYYEQWAQPWEIQALLRADAVAGDDGAGPAIPVHGRQDPLPLRRGVRPSRPRDPSDEGPHRLRASSARC